jgi:hypothetical protein
MDEYSSLDLVAENGTFQDVIMNDYGETMQLDTYGNLWHISRQALINDDQDAFARVPMLQGQAAARTVGDLAYAVLAANPVMGEDGVTLFNASHNNIAAVAAAPSVASLTAMSTAMYKQKGPKSLATLAIEAQTLLVPIELRDATNVLIASQYDPSATAGTLTPNPHKSGYNVVADHRLTNPAEWYAFANPNQVDTVEVAFLNGQETPYMERKQQDIAVDAITYKVRLDVGAGVRGWRGVYKNAGV